MVTNRRTYYAIESVAFAKIGTTTYTGARGVQSVGTSTKYNLEPYFEVGQSTLYENKEGIPEVDYTISKCLDGQPPIYCLATNGATSPTLQGRSNVSTIIGLSIFSDTANSASGVAVNQSQASGQFVNSLSWTFPVQGVFTEEVGFIGNQRIWGTSLFTAPTFNNTDSPLAGTASGNVNIRQDILFGAAASLLPLDIPGVSASGTNELQSDGSYTSHIQSIKISTSLNRQPFYELGRRGLYFRPINFPVEVKCDIEVFGQSGDNVAALQDSSANLTNRTIYIKAREGTILDLGNRNKLASVTTNGLQAQANSQSETIVFSYSTYNDLTVTHPQDPSGL